MKRNAWQKQAWNKKEVTSPWTLQEIRQRLKHISDTPYLDAQLILSHYLDRPRSWVLAHPEPPLSSDDQSRIANALGQLERGIPLPYVIGQWEFYHLTFEITPDVLIPRPETELLVDYAIDWLENHPAKSICADIGTGSGCMAVSIAHHVPQAQFIANDISLESVKVARKNVHRHNLQSQISLFQGHLLEALHGPFDLVLANLPYIPSSRLMTLPVYEREPTQALDGGKDGLKYITEFLASAPQRVEKGGLILLEINETQGEDAARLGERAFPRGSVSIEQDLAGLDRMLVIQMASPRKQR